MIATQHTQSLTDFRQKAAETLERLNQSNDAEIITVNGEARAVLLSPAAYDEMARELMLARDVEMIRRSMKDFEEGKSMEVNAFFEKLRGGSVLPAKAGRPAGRRL